MEIQVERRTRTEGEIPTGGVRDEDLEPHAGLRYIARLFKVLAVLTLLVLVAEIVIAVVQGSAAVLSTVMVEATRLVIFGAFLWAAGDIALMLIESNHDLRAARILLGRLAARQPPVDGSAGGERRPPPVT